jgi:hypothetical protein
LGIILDAFLGVGFIPMNNDRLADMLSFIFAVLISSLVIGYVFALSIQEGSRIKTIGVVDVLSTFTFIVFDSIWICTYWGNEWFQREINSAFSPPSGWTAYDYVAHSLLLVSFLAIIGFVVIFIGLYAGSMLRTPKKT